MKQVASQRSLKPSSTRRTLVVAPTRINRIFNCGRWHLRATKIRQSRVVHSKSITNSITSPSKRKQKRSFSPNPSEQSSTADNYTSDMSTEGDPMWPSQNIKTFLDIMLDEVNKEGGTVSRKGRTFTPRQWRAFDEEMFKRVGKSYGEKKLKGKFSRLQLRFKEFSELINHTGLGWDPIKLTVTGPQDLLDSYCQAHPNASSFIDKGLPYFDELSQLLTGKYATGTFARGSTEGAPTSDEEQEILRCRFKSTQLGEGSARGKRKGDDSLEERSSKSSKMDSALEAWTAASRAREQYFGAQVQSSSAVIPQSDPYGVKECMNILQEMSHVEVSAKLKAVTFFAQLEWRQIFVEMEPDLRAAWLASL